MLIVSRQLLALNEINWLRIKSYNTGTVNVYYIATPCNNKTLKCSIEREYFFTLNTPCNNKTLNCSLE